MSSEHYDIEKSYNELMQSHMDQELYGSLAELDAEADELWKFSLLEQTLKNNGLDLKDVGIADYFQYNELLYKTVTDPTCHRIYETITVLGILEYKDTPFNKVEVIEDDLVARLENIYLFTDEYDEVWLKSLRDILPKAKLLATDSTDNHLIRSYREKSLMRRDIGRNIHLLRRSARLVLEKSITEMFGEHDDNSSIIAKIVAGVVAFYEGEDSETYDMALSLSCSTLRGLGFNDKEAMEFLSSTHDKALETDPFDY
jgi:hypothetical protein